MHSSQEELKRGQSSLGAEEQWEATMTRVQGYSLISHNKELVLCTIRLTYHNATGTASGHDYSHPRSCEPKDQTYIVLVCT